jgi:hypothetical protein
MRKLMIGTIAQSGWSLFEKTTWFREAGLDTKTLKRLVLTECRKNLALLEPLKLQDSKVAQNAPAIVGIASKLQYESIEILLAIDDKSHKAFKELDKVPFETSATDSEDSMEVVVESNSNQISLSTRIQRLYVRMHAVKTFAEIEIGGAGGQVDGSTQIKFRMRLANIQKVLLALEKLLANESSV